MSMVVATLLWGATFVVLRDILRRVPPSVLVCARFAIAALLVAGIAIALRRMPNRATLVGGCLSGTLTYLGYLLQAMGLTTVSAGTSAFLTTAGTLGAGLFAWPILKQRPGGALALGLILGGAGALLLAGRIEIGWTSGEVLTLCGAACYALQIVMVAAFVKGADPLAVAGVQALVVALMAAPRAAIEFGRMAPLSVDDLWRLGYLAIAGSLIAPWLQICAQQALAPGRIGLLFALEPVFALMFALLVGERFGAHWWWGAALILFAVTWVEGRAAARAASSRRASA